MAPDSRAEACEAPTARWRRRTACSIPTSLAMLAVSACGSGGTSSSSVTSTATPPPAPGLVANLGNLPQGQARISLDARTRRVVIHLQLAGLVPNTAHAVHLHKGTCLARTDETVGTFEDLRSDAHGAISADVTSTSSTGGAIPTGVFLDVHLVGGASLGSATGRTSIPLVCADVPDNAAAAALALFPTPGYKPFGTASIRLDAARRSLDVAVTLSALVPGSSHAVQVVAGTCAQPGEVVHAVGDVTADAGGSVKASETVDGVDAPPPVGGWNLVIRTGATAEDGTPAQPTPLAQALLCGPLTPQG